MKNKDLKLKYNDIYKGGAYENYYTFNMFPSEMLIINFIENWTNLEVLDIGCGEGNLAAMLSFKGASKIDGVDYSNEAISIAKDRININNVNFICKDYRKITQKYDVVAMNGVFEHFDNPWKELDFILTNLCKKNGTVITQTGTAAIDNTPNNLLGKIRNKLNVGKKYHSGKISKGVAKGSAGSPTAYGSNVPRPTKIANVPRITIGKTYNKSFGHAGSP